MKGALLLLLLALAASAAIARDLETWGHHGKKKVKVVPVVVKPKPVVVVKPKPVVVVKPKPAVVVVAKPEQKYPVCDGAVLASCCYLPIQYDYYGKAASTCKIVDKVAVPIHPWYPKKMVAKEVVKHLYLASYPPPVYTDGASFACVCPTACEVPSPCSPYPCTVHMPDCGGYGK